MGRRDPSGSPLWQPLLQRATATPESHFALLALFQHRRDITQDNLETTLDRSDAGGNQVSTSSNSTRSISYGGPGMTFRTWRLRRSAKCSTASKPTTYSRTPF